MIDYQEIIESLEDDRVFKLLEDLGGEPQDFPDYIISKTICHHPDEEIEEASHKLYYYKNSHLFVCYTSCQNLSIFKLLKSYYEVRQIEYDWYNDILKVILNCSYNRDLNLNGVERYKSERDKYLNNSKNFKKLQTYPNSILNCFVEYWAPEWTNEGITIDAMKKYNICYSILQNKIIIPHYDADGELVGIRGRALNEEDIENFGKYMPVQIENTWYSHPLGLNLYGFNLNKENIKKNGFCFIWEGEKSVIKMENFSNENCSVAVCGSKLSKYQFNLLFKECCPKEIIICFDKEELPKKHTYFDKLWSICEKYKNYCNMSFIYDRNELLDMKDSPIDKGNEVFKKLLERRVKV